MLKSGKGTYKMTIDMSEVKGMLDMVKTMGQDSTNTAGAPAPAEDPNDMSKIGQDMTKVTELLKGLDGVTNVVENSDTATYIFGYSFDFKDVKALNNALRVIGKDKFQEGSDEIYKLDGKNFTRLAAGDLTKEIKNAFSDEEGDENADMMKMFLADMSYKQVYNFPDREIKNSTNDLSEISADKHSVSIMLKPFDEEQIKKNAGVATQLKLK